jgi:anti-sigma factor RsiW
LTEHLAPAILNALADGELSALELTAASAHLAECPACTSAALALSLQKSATARAGQRFVAPAGLRDRIAAQLAAPKPEPVRKTTPYLWAGIAALLILGISLFVARRPDTNSLAQEIADQHIATLAANAPPQVISSDRHTVKPWFQGRIPFSFNLPQTLPADVTLDGANLTYLHGQPAAQLLYSIGKHHASIFLQQRSGASPIRTDRNGFHLVTFTTPSLEAVAISDADPTRLSELAHLLEQAQ